MAERHHLQTTSEEVRWDGTVVSSTELEIAFDFVWGHDGYYDPIVGTDHFPEPDEVVLVGVIEKTPSGDWQPASETRRVLAEYLVDEKPELFYNHVRKATLNV